MARTTKQIKRTANQLFRLCVVNGRLDEHRARQVVGGVLQSRRRGYLALLKQFRRLLKLDVDRHTAQVESALPLPADLRGSVQNRLETVYGRGLATEFARNPALIGGIRIKVGSDVYDGSLQYRLVELARSFGITGANGRHAAI
jgi:F-type H+-transporting ATPase subunit delta